MLKHPHYTHDTSIRCGFDEGPTYMARRLVWKRPLFGGLKPTCSECNWSSKARRTLVKVSFKRMFRETAMREFKNHKCKDHSVKRNG